MHVRASISSMYDSENDEREQLLPQQRPSLLEVGNRTSHHVVGTQECYDEPPPYTPSMSTPTYSGSNVTVGSEVPVINCRVCHTLLQIEGKLHLHVIKCDVCNEATPIRPPPAMKKYVRCPCNCLLICAVSSQRIVCPRMNCKRVISLIPTVDEYNTMSNPPAERHSARRVICAYCNFSFQGKRLNKSLQMCPHCGKKSFSGLTFRQYKLRCLGIFFVVLLILSAIMSFLAFGHLFHSTTLLIFAAITYFFILVFIIALSYYCCCLKVSRIEEVSSHYT